jgi:hypothetical protein
MRVHADGRRVDYVAAGILAGLTASAKYNGGIVILSVVAAHLLRYRDGRASAAANVALALACCAAAFLATTPYALLDYPAFIKDVDFIREHYRTGHAGMEGDPFRWYSAYLWHTTGAIAVLALIEIARGALRRDAPTILLATFPVAYFAFIGSYEVRNDRTLLPLLPFVFLLAATLVVRTRRPQPTVPGGTGPPASASPGSRSPSWRIPCPGAWPSLGSSTRPTAARPRGTGSRATFLTAAASPSSRMRRSSRRATSRFPGSSRSSIIRRSGTSTKASTTSY